MNLTKEIISKKVFDLFKDYTWNYLTDLSDLAVEILENCDTAEIKKAIEKDELSEFIFECMNNSLIYTEDQWKMLKLYCEPQKADFDLAWSEFENDLYKICESLKEEEEDN